MEQTFISELNFTKPDLTDKNVPVTKELIEAMSFSKRQNWLTKRMSHYGLDLTNGQSIELTFDYEKCYWRIWSLGSDGNYGWHKLNNVLELLVAIVQLAFNSGYNKHKHEVSEMLQSLLR